ncbi:hypothetical protein TNIN_67641 [Trichonephila inaurata madagascariensis]|uniref:Uncharacterized protein n=1 Tax=Trichonephila inaurata madagascariensis TaxID=2747483 RepID=A0A8X6IHQ9_9ARAC|nr:hypothetical protein TNIN_67641 [Trichonephila inaurata madagascariensis]
MITLNYHGFGSLPLDPSYLIALMQVPEFSPKFLLSTSLWTEKVSRPKSFYSIKKLIKRSIKACAQEDVYNRVSHKSWRKAILNLRNGPKPRVVTKFRLATGHDCLRIHLYRISYCFPDMHSVQLWRGHGLRTSSTPFCSAQNVSRRSLLGG